MGINKNEFGMTKDGKEAFIYTLVNKNGMSAEVTDYGATLVAVNTTDKNGRLDDVLLGYEDVTDYIENGGYLGATVGRNCNRVKGASVSINGQAYELDKNENGNDLHSGFHGYDSCIWDTKMVSEENSVVFSRMSPDGEQGFPGNFQISVTYTLTEENELKIHYCGKCDQDTIANMTNHSYFNLAGQDSGEVTGHILMLDADTYLPIDGESIPTGEIREVAGTPFDFREPKAIGRDIGADDEQLKLAHGYDHNFLLRGGCMEVRKIADVLEPVSGRTMEVFTDCPGIQLYTGNFLENTQIGKEGTVYGPHHGFCMETQFYPDTPHHEEFPSSILKAGEEYSSTTIYKFGIRA